MAKGPFRAGEEVAYRVTFLEMTAHPSYDWPTLPSGVEPASLLCAADPPVWYFRTLYAAVGAGHAWEDMDDEPDAVLQRWLGDPRVRLWSLLRAGWPQGFFVLDATDQEATELSYLGLVPEAVGLGYGRFLLRSAVLTAWQRPGLRRLKVNTCTLDHPRALAAYQQAGFGVVATEERRRILRRDLDTGALRQ
ncbi:MAG: GNAT family N-acetyltransferase [Alkalilacustris sp.]